MLPVSFAPSEKRGSLLKKAQGHDSMPNIQQKQQHQLLLLHQIHQHHRHHYKSRTTTAGRTIPPHDPPSFSYFAPDLTGIFLSTSASALVVKQRHHDQYEYRQHDGHNNTHHHVCQSCSTSEQAGQHQNDTNCHSCDCDHSDGVHSYKSQASSFYIPGITARARCLEEQHDNNNNNNNNRNSNNNKKLDARTLYSPSNTSDKERRPLYITTSSVGSTRDQGDIISCLDDEDHVAVIHEHASLTMDTTNTNHSTKKHKSKEKKQKKEKQKSKYAKKESSVKRMERESSVTKGDHLVDQQGITTETISSHVVTTCNNDDLDVKDNGHKHEFLQSQLCTFRSLLRTQKERLHMSLREEVAKVA